MTHQPAPDNPILRAMTAPAEIPRVEPVTVMPVELDPAAWGFASMEEMERAGEEL